jgi:hypothetical protein
METDVIVGGVLAVLGLVLYSAAKDGPTVSPFYHPLIGAWLAAVSLFLNKPS